LRFTIRAGIIALGNQALEIKNRRGHRRFFERERFLSNFAERLDAFGAHGGFYCFAILPNCQSLKIGMEGAIGGPFGM